MNPFDICIGADVHYLDMIYRISDPQNAIKKVIFTANAIAPATIVYWIDGTTTIVKSEKGTMFDPEKGLAMAISKKFFGNRDDYHNVFRRYLENAKVSDIKEKYERLLDVLVGAETDLCSCRRYIDAIFEKEPSLREQMMKEYSGMPGYEKGDENP